VCGATWVEIDFEAKVWTVPAARMKAGELHRVPLSDTAIKVLAQVRPEMPKATAIIFANTRGTALSDMALTMLVRGMALNRLDEGEPPRWRDAAGRAVVPHGFRSGFRD
jgi:integrase